MLPVELLQKLIATPSFSGEEAETAVLIGNFLSERGIPHKRHINNVWAISRHFNTDKPTVLLCSHHDTVKPNQGYTRDPFAPDIVDGKLYGLGSNDAGGCLVALVAAFCHFYDMSGLPFNLVLAAVAEEERSGENGLEALLPFLPALDCAIIGEPTQLNLAVAEKGLMVLDCIATGRAGHAARNEGDNALYRAMRDIEWFSNYRFPRLSEWIGPVKMTVTSVETPNKAHNVVPDMCRFIVDVRLTDMYTPDELLQVIRDYVESSVYPRSTRLRSTAIDLQHPLVQAGLALGKRPYASPTTSDKAVTPVPALKVGPGDSARSHTPDEFIYLTELEAGIQFYIDLLEQTTFIGNNPEDNNRTPTSTGTPSNQS
jgi:acetylornithine deacetylase